MSPAVGWRPAHDRLNALPQVAVRLGRDVDANRERLVELAGALRDS